MDVLNFDMATYIPALHLESHSPALSRSGVFEVKVADIFPIPLQNK